MASGRGEIAYSNLGFALLGQALATRAGETYDHLLRQRLLDPLGMRDTVLVSDPHALPRGHATGNLTSGHEALPWSSDGFAAAPVPLVKAPGMRANSRGRRNTGDHLLAAVSMAGRSSVGILPRAAGLPWEGCPPWPPNRCPAQTCAFVDAEHRHF